MAKTNISTTARQVELIIRQLDSLSTLPEVATTFLTTVAGKKLDKFAITQIIQADPALTAKVLSLAFDRSVTFTNGKPTVKEAVARLPEDSIRRLILSLRIFNQPNSPESDNSLPVKQLALHCLTVACAAEQIAAITLQPQQQDIAFSAALLHDIGKLAVAELMPKSFVKIAADASEFNLSSCAAEQRNLGIDHTIIGKRLAEKWHLPDEVKTAIWLHHSDTEAISENLASGKITQVVTLANTIANQSGIGNSGNNANNPITPEMLQSLNLTHRQIETIKTGLPEKVRAKSDLLGFTNPDAKTAYSQLLRETAEELANDYKNLSTGNRTLAAASAHMELICQFLLAVKPEMDTTEVLEIFAAAWQKHYQTGPVCVFTKFHAGQDTLELVSVDDSNQPNTILANLPEDAQVLPAQFYKKFAVLKTDETTDWIFDQLDFHMNRSSTIILPLLERQRPVGAILFEHRSPSDPADQTESLSRTAAVAAAVIAMTDNCGDQERLSEKFANLLGQLKEAREKLTEARSLIGVAEMAAGASHELNNPLAVISGRTQLLMDIETDENKKQMLKQIHTRADEVSQIVAELMAFAKPSAPNPVSVDIENIIGSAVRQIEEEYNITKLELNLESPADTPSVQVDINQVAAAIKNILSNALESCTGDNGPIYISIDIPKEKGFVTVRIKDNGCGMDAETLSKATEPFFSAKPAGRKRGMGLAHARRLLTLNDAQLHIQSTKDQGTTVTIKFKV